MRMKTFTRKLAGLAGWKITGNLAYKCFGQSKADYAKSVQTCKQYGGTLAAKVLRDVSRIP